MVLTLRELQEAVIAYQGGDLRRAESSCLKALRLEPNSGLALRILGFIACQQGNHSAGVEYLQRSLTLNPRQSDAHAALGGALLLLGRPAEALAHIERALVTEPGSAPLRYNRGCALLQLQRYEEALGEFDVSLATSPPTSATLANRGTALQKLSRLEEALECLEGATLLEPDNGLIQYNCGNILSDLKRPEDALARYERAQRLHLSTVELLNNRGNVLRSLGRFREAIASYECALRLNGRAPEPLNNLGATLLDQGRIGPAISIFERVLHGAPNAAAVLDNYALALRFDGRAEDAARTYEALRRVDPDFLGVRGNLHFSRAMCCDWRDFETSVEAVIASVRAGRVENPFLFLAVSGNAELQRQCGRQFAEEHGWLPARAPTRSGSPYGHERLRVVYISADFRQHSVTSLLTGVIEHHDRERFAVFGLSLQPMDGSAEGQRIAAAFDDFSDVSECSDREIATWLRDRQIDIAIDLMGYTRSCRPGIFRDRPAPVQVNYLGFPGGLGTSLCDFIIADDYVIPPEAEAGYEERVVRLPNCFQPNDNRRAIGPTPSRDACKLPEDGLVFCCFNSPFKISPGLFDIWMRLLAHVPGSVFWTASSSNAARQNLQREAAQRGIPAERIVVGAQLPYSQHLARLANADLFLDTVPFNGGTTISDALWAGVPVLTSSGEAFASRMAGSLLHSMGLSDLVTPGLETYEALAMKLATQPHLLRAVRARVAKSRAESPLFDTLRYCRNLEAVYTAMCAPG